MAGASDPWGAAAAHLYALLQVVQLLAQVCELLHCVVAVVPACVVWTGVGVGM
jgi:hypothetical protein